MEILLVALVVTTTAAPLVRRALLRRGVLDVPNERSSHSTPVPRGGGIACVAGAAAGVAVAAVEHRPVPWPALAGVAVLAAVGFLDDRRSLRAVQRLALQSLVGAVVGATSGGVWWAVAGAVVLPVTVNAVNFMDGINGITALNMAVWGVTAMLVGGEGGGVVALGAAAAGSALGFLPWNAPEARLFLGDIGSYFFGAAIGVALIEAGAHSSPKTFLLLVPLFVYLTDTAATLARRIRRRAPLMTAHREHTYQLLTNNARLSHLHVAVLVALVSMGMTAIWILCPRSLSIATTILGIIIYLASPRLFARITARRRIHSVRGEA